MWSLPILIKPHQKIVSLPSIYQLVDAMIEFSLISFMDAYSGYNQIMMHPRNEKKTSFITKEGTFCYTRSVSKIQEHLTNDW